MLFFNRDLLSKCLYLWDDFFGRGRAVDLILFPFFVIDSFLVSSSGPEMKYIPRIWKSLRMINASRKTAQFIIHNHSTGVALEQLTGMAPHILLVAFSTAVLPHFPT